MVLLPADNPGLVLQNGDTLSLEQLATLLGPMIGGGSIAYDAKGDLIVGTGDDAIQRLPVGADGQSLVADSSVISVGIKWSTPSGTGNVVGPASAVDNHVAIFSGTSGKAIKTAGMTITAPVVDHEAKVDPHPQYAFDSDVAAKQPINQRLTDLSLTTYTGNALKYLRVNAATDNWELAPIVASGDMYKSDNLAGLVDYSTARSNLGLGTAAIKNITVSSAAPSGGIDGDIWLQYTV